MQMMLKQNYFLLMCFLFFSSYAYAQEPAEVYIKSIMVDEYIEFQNSSGTQYVYLSDFLVVEDNRIHIEVAANVEGHLFWAVQADLDGNHSFEESLFNQETEGTSNLEANIPVSEEVMREILNRDIGIRVLVSTKEGAINENPELPSSVGAVIFRGTGPIKIGNTADNDQDLNQNHPCLERKSNIIKSIYVENISTGQNIPITHEFNSASYAYINSCIINNSNNTINSGDKKYFNLKFDNRFIT